MYFEFFNRTQILNFGFFGEGECDFQRKVAIVEICCLPALTKNPEYYIAGKCASPLSEFSGSTPGNYSSFNEMLQKCTLGALYFTGLDLRPSFNFLRVQLAIPLTLNILMRSIFGWTGGWLLWPGSNGDMICANRIIFCTLRRPSSVLSRRTVWRAIKSFSWIPAGRKNHSLETFWKINLKASLKTYQCGLPWEDGAHVSVLSE